MKEKICQDEVDLLHQELLKYADWQRQYIEEMRRGDIVKLQEWTEDVCRLQIFLKQLFTEAGKSCVSEKKRNGLWHLFEKIKRQANELRQLMVAKSQQMAAEIPHLRRGKMVLQGYALAHHASQNIFLSSKG